MEQKYIVVGPVNGLYYTAYRVPGTNVFQPTQEFTSERLAQDVAAVLNGE